MATEVISAALPQWQHKLSEPARVWHRCSARIMELDTVIFFDAKAHAVKQYEPGRIDPKRFMAAFGLPGSSEDRNPFEVNIPLADVLAIKSRDYVERSQRWVFILLIVHKSHKQDSFTFPRASARDSWATGLQLLLACGVVGNNEEVEMGLAHRNLAQEAPTLQKRSPRGPETESSAPAEAAPAPLTDGAPAVATAKSVTREKSRLKHPITRVLLQRPPPGFLASLTVQVGENPADTLNVPDSAAREGCKRCVAEFLREHPVVPGDATSLYRFVKSVTQRAIMESETRQILSEMQELSFTSLMANQRKSDAVMPDSTPFPSPTARPAEVLKSGNDGLKRLKGELRDRVCSRGPASEILVHLLARCIEKAKLVNQLSEQAHTLQNRKSLVDAAQAPSMEQSSVSDPLLGIDRHQGSSASADDSRTTRPSFHALQSYTPDDVALT